MDKLAFCVIEILFKRHGLFPGRIIRDEEEILLIYVNSIKKCMKIVIDDDLGVTVIIIKDKDILSCDSITIFQFDEIINKFMRH